MASVGETTGDAKGREEKEAIERAGRIVGKDKRDVADLWTAALKAYKNVVGFELTARAANAEGLIAIGVDEMNKFHRFRHDGEKVDKLRSLFSTNLDLLEEGSKQLLAAATPAFPPAAAIGTAMTWMLSACRQVSADYDVVEVFFNDMNSFLRRVAILEKRLPTDKGYQNCLMDVFTSFLRMCGFATVYIKLGRFAKWVKNLLQGDDGELGQAREDMNLKVQNLDQATRFAILSNSVEEKKMVEELKQNMEDHKQMMKDHGSALRKLEAKQEKMHADITKLLKAFESTQKDRLTRNPAMAPSSVARQNKAASASRIRSTLPAVDGEISEYHILKETVVDGTCTWVFSQPEWLTWTAEGGPSLLAITGGPGSGKSHIAAMVYDYLEQQRAADPDQRLCAAHFYFREQNPYLAVFRNAVITAVNQVAEQNPTLCERIYAQLVRDDVRVDYDWRSLLRDLLQPCFEAKTRYRLFLLLDSIDELDDTELAELGEFWNTIVADGLSISLGFTSRPESARFPWPITDDLASSPSILTIQVTKKLQIRDFAAILRNQLGNLESLKRFSPYAKQQIFEKIEGTAPNLLYAHHMLRYFNSIGREGAVLVRLQEPLPESLDAVYEVMLNACMRRTVKKYRKVVGALFCWLSFSFRPLMLDEVVSLLRHESGEAGFDLDDIPEPMTHFVRIGDPGRGSDSVQTGDVDYLLTGEVIDPMGEDGRLPVRFRQRAMRSFFCQAGTNSTSKATRNPVLISPSEAHRRIFLAASRMCRLAPEGSESSLDRGLTHYATFYLMYHWMRIQPKEHLPEERAEIMEALASVMSNEHGYSKMAQEVGINYRRDFGDDVFVRMRSWASEMTGEQLNGLMTGTASWWRSVADQPATGLIEIAKGHIRDLYQARSTSEAVGASDCAIAALLRSGHGNQLFRQAFRIFVPDAGPMLLNPRFVRASATYENGIRGLLGLFKDIPTTPSAYRAIASVLLVKGHPRPARAVCAMGLACKPDAFEKFTLLYLAAQAALNIGMAQAASRSISECLNLQDIGSVPEPLQGWAHVVQARVYARLNKRTAAAEAFSKARTFDKGTVTGDILDEEATIYRDANDYVGLINVLRSWSSIERFAWLTLDHSDSVRGLDLHKLAESAEQWEYLVKIYEEVIGQLEKFAAAAPLQCDLANAHLLVRGNAEAARTLLDKVLDDHSDGYVYRFTYEDPRSVLVRAVNLQSRALWELFTRSRDPVEKTKFMDAARGLMKRPLASCVSSFSTTDTLYHETQVARMSLQMGPRLDFQARLQCVIKTCFDTLEDDVAWNDRRSLWLLSQALAHLDKAVGGRGLHHVARILLSAYFNILDPALPKRRKTMVGREDSGTWIGTVDAGASNTPSTQPQTRASRPPPMQKAIVRGAKAANVWPPTTRQAGSPSPGGFPADEGDFYGTSFLCDGSSCRPRVRFRGFQGRSMYVCIDCDYAAFCEECHDALKADHDGTVPFCGRHHEHIKAPIEGWHGITNGVMRIEGGKNVPFKTFLHSVRDKLLKNAWLEFWGV